MKTNCWEFKKCGYEPGGININKSGICPAATETKVNGINGGKNAGRCCWAVTGTFRGGIVQGTFSQKVLDCMTCDFYRAVMHEEGADFEKPDKIIELLRES